MIIMETNTLVSKSPNATTDSHCKQSISLILHFVLLCVVVTAIISYVCITNERTRTDDETEINLLSAW